MVPYAVAMTISGKGPEKHSAQRDFVKLGKQIENVGEVRNDIAIQAFGRLLRGISSFYLGELVAARALLEQDAAPSHPPVDRRDAHFHALRLAAAGLTLAHLGHVDQARSRVDEALSQARRMRSALTLAQMLVYANVLDLATGSPLIHAEELLALSTGQKLAQWQAWATAFRGLALAAAGQAGEAFALLTQSLAQLRAIGAMNGLPRLLVSLARVSARIGQSAEAWRYIAEAARMIEATDERMYEAEVVYEAPGDLLNAAGDLSGAEQYYRQAIAVAERRSAKLSQLRSSIRLARLWHDQGRRAEAHDLLGPVYGWFTEGFDVPILKEARALLDETG